MRKTKDRLQDAANSLEMIVQCHHQYTEGAITHKEFSDRVLVEASCAHATVVNAKKALDNI